MELDDAVVRFERRCASAGAYLPSIADRFDLYAKSFREKHPDKSTSVSDWVHRREAAMPFQTWMPFEPDDIVQVKNAHGDSATGPARLFWWGYETWGGVVTETVITSARRLSKKKVMKT